ncbi:MAG: DUF4091 domain-containing protein [Prevotellaceae bacterium]|jgi:hypothetical protein|nr:DUF4091 domain-containing protein [Prevotellaceae bacterium]
MFTKIIYKYCLFAFAIFISQQSGYAQATNDEIMCVQLDHLDKILKEFTYFEEKNDTMEVAKGETATFQFVLRSIYSIKNLKIEALNLTKENNKIPPALKAFVGYVRLGQYSDLPSKDRLLSPSGYFPDQLFDIESIDVASLSNQPVWITYPIPKDASPGIYAATLSFSGIVNGKKFTIKKQIYAKVYDVVLPEQTLWVTNHFNSSTALAYMNNQEPVVRFSDRYWELLKILANSMGSHGQNTYLISPLEFCKYKIDGLNYSFDFTDFDNMVEFFIREGGLKRIEGGYLGGHIVEGDYKSPIGVTYPVKSAAPGESTVFRMDTIKQQPLENDTLHAFLTQFFPALYHHLRNKGWDKMYIQHISDEPGDAAAKSYIQISEFLHRLAPEIKVIDAVVSNKLANSVDIWVPVLHNLNKDYAFFQEQQKRAEVWFYTCVTPQGNYANRFIELPLLQMRILHWINYRFNITGYLHWGFNHWHLQTPGEAAYHHPTANMVWPAGDTYIVYPGYNKVYSSIRLEAMRDGIADYELLKLLEQKYPEKAKEIAKFIVLKFDSYDCSIGNFRQTRTKILKLLSQESER